MLLIRNRIHIASMTFFFLPSGITLDLNFNLAYPCSSNVHETFSLNKTNLYMKYLTRKIVLFNKGSNLRRVMTPNPVLRVR